VKKKGLFALPKKKKILGKVGEGKTQGEKENLWGWPQKQNPKKKEKRNQR